MSVELERALAENAELRARLAGAENKLAQVLYTVRAFEHDPLVAPLGLAIWQVLREP